MFHAASFNKEDDRTFGKLLSEVSAKECSPNYY